MILDKTYNCLFFNDVAKQLCETHFGILLPKTGSKNFWDSPSQESGIQISTYQIDSERLAVILNPLDHAEKEIQTVLLSIINNTSDSIWAIDEDFNFLAFNEKYKELVFRRYGIVPQIGMNAVAFLPPELKDFWLQHYYRALLGEVVAFEHQILNQGRVEYRATSINPRFVDGQIRGVTVFSRDITSQKIADERIKISQEIIKLTSEKLEGIINSTEDEIFAVDKDLRYTAFNQSHANRIFKMYGFAIEIGTSITHAALEEEFVDKINFFTTALSGKRLTVESTVRRGDEKRIYEFTYNPLRKECEDKPFGIALFVKDITDRKRAEKKLLKTQKSLEEAQLLAKLGIYEYSFKERAFWWSDSLYSIFGLDKLVFEPSFDLYLAFLDEESREKYSAILAQRLEKYKVEVSLRRKRKKIFLEDNGEIRYDRNGNPVFARGTLQDITERKLSEIRINELNANLERLVAERTEKLEREIAERIQAEENLKTAKEAAESASRAKTSFLANMSHEIRSPLNAILGFSQLIEMQMSRMSLPSEVQQYLDHIRVSGQNLAELINNILDLSKIESGKVEVVRENINLRQLVQAIFHINKAAAARKEIQFSYEWDESLPRYILADRNKLNQILMNLVSNAIKFTPEFKRVFLRARREDSILILEVEDEGIGIDEHQLEKVFLPFEQGDNSSTRLYGGTGLGLSIAKNMTELMGGTISVSSRVGQGSVFRVRLPLIPADTQVKPRKTLDINRLKFPPNLKILVAEDNVLNREIIEKFLNQLGFTVIMAANGRQAVEMAFRHNPDLILMDIQMPIMDGFMAASKIRENPDFAKVPIVAVSADAFLEQQKEAIGSGFSNYITKPIDFKELASLLMNYFALQDKETEAVQHESDPQKAKLIMLSIRQIPIYQAEQLMKLRTELSLALSDAYREELYDLEDAIFEADQLGVERVLDEISRKLGLD